MRCRALLGRTAEGGCPYAVCDGLDYRGRVARGHTDIHGHTQTLLLQGTEFVLVFFYFFLFGWEAGFQEPSGKVLAADAEGDCQA
jgi:hypothetical protein